ncbi:MAG: TIGR04211 family SH3 domain-containing protein [Pseudomonadota bacterium]|nr:MAG: TIGR04211 family SH3 domain-containing protein [Pseudomonadota bacterium]
MKGHGYRFVLILTTLLLAGGVQGETLYVTDNIMLGLHQEAAEESVVLKALPSGTAVQVLERQDNFVRVRQSDGAEGWLNSDYLVKVKPARSLLTAAQAQQKQAESELAKLKEDLKKKERDLQIHQDELANARTSIKELKASASASAAATPDSEPGKPPEQAAEQPAAPDPELQQQLATANEMIVALNARIKELESTPTDADAMRGELAQLRKDNLSLTARINLAQANLRGEDVPSPEELVSIEPGFPMWYWGILVVMLIAGFVGGVAWFDYSHRKRHGGFRI